MSLHGNCPPSHQDKIAPLCSDISGIRFTIRTPIDRFERDRISERTREALAVKRGQRVRLGRPSNLTRETVASRVTERDAGSSLRAIADGLTRDGIATAQGGLAWHASTVRKVLGSQHAVRSGLDILPNEELAAAGRIDDEHPPDPRVQAEVALTQTTNLEA